MYLKCHSRFKDGKEHHYYSIAEKVSCAGGRRVERHVFYLGEVNDSQREAWIKQIEAFDLQTQQETKLALFASDRPVPAHAAAGAVQVRLAEFCLCRPRQWGGCWLFLLLWDQLKLGVANFFDIVLFPKLGSYGFCALGRVAVVFFSQITALWSYGSGRADSGRTAIASGGFSSACHSGIVNNRMLPGFPQWRRNGGFLPLAGFLTGLAS